MGFEARVARDGTYHKADFEVVSDKWFQCPKTISVAIGGEKKPIEADIVAEENI